MSSLAPVDRRDDRTLPSLSSIFGPAQARPSTQAGFPQPIANANPFPPRAPSPHFNGILRPVNSLHNLPTYKPPNGFAHPPPPQSTSAFAQPVRDLPALDRVHISTQHSSSHLAPPPPPSIFGAAPSYRPAPAPTSSGYPSYYHGRNPSESTATTTDVQSSRSSTAYSTSNATSVSDISSVRSSSVSTVSRSTAKIVGVQEIPGEGECYVYEDGSFMRAVIGGERVNPAWGITKAGKPRKRLAKACMTCREKKIKCEQGEPGDTRCGQCARTNRVCRVPQDLRSSPEPESSRGSAAVAAAPPPQPPSEERLVLTQGFHDSTMRKRTHDMLHFAAPPPDPMIISATTPTDEKSAGHSPNVLQDRPRDYFSEPAAPNGTVPMAMSDLTPRRRAKQSSKGRHFSSPRAPHRVDPKAFDEHHDPYTSDPEATIYFLELFFYFRNRGAYAALPRQAFLTWVRASREKSVDDRMVIFSLMALGSRYSFESDLKDCGKAFYEIAYRIERQRASKFTLQLIHARTGLLFYLFAMGEYEMASECIGNAVRALNMLRFQDENCIANVPDEHGIYEYGMTANQLRECRRRSFWLIYMVDRFNSFTSGSMGLIRDAEVFLRMPCAEHDFATSMAVDMPLFQGNNRHEPYKTRPGDMSLLTDIASTWGHVTEHAYASVHQPSSLYLEHYAKHFERTVDEMRNWVSWLPSDLRFSHDNMTAALTHGYFAQYYILHTVYCLVGMKLGRIGRVELLPDDVKRRNLRVAMFHARLYLHMISTLSKAMHTTLGEDVDMTFSQPFPGYAITNAVDIVSSGGKASALAAMTNNELEAAKMVVEQKANFWLLNKDQQQLIDDRQGLLSAYGINGGHKTDRHRVPEAIDRTFLPRGLDMVYEVSDDVFFDVVLDETTKEQDPLGILS